jgi:tRNA dimethylallyltransferase
VKVIVVAGPTGTGKSDLAVRLAAAARGEIVNYDSIQIYRGFDIGSAKPSLETRRLVPHHLFDVAGADADFNAANFEQMALRVCQEITERGNTPILVGGTFFYLRAFLSGLPEMPARDEATRSRLRRIADTARGPARLHRWLSRVDPTSGDRIARGDRHRVERALEVWIGSRQPISQWKRPDSNTTERIPSLKIALQLPRTELVRRLDERVDGMYRAGLIDETRALLQRYSPDARPFSAIGYREAVLVINGALSLDAATAETRRRTRAYAKRQMTWLRSERNVQWLDAAERDQSFSAALRLIERFTVD